MALKGEKGAAKAFAEYWAAQRGSEKGEDQTFWNSLLGEVLGVGDLKDRIQYQLPVYYNDGSTKFLDAWIPETQVLSEHTSKREDKILSGAVIMWLVTSGSMLECYENDAEVPFSGFRKRGDS